MSRFFCRKVGKYNYGIHSDREEEVKILKDNTGILIGICEDHTWIIDLGSNKFIKKDYYMQFKYVLEMVRKYLIKQGRKEDWDKAEKALMDLKDKRLLQTGR